MKRIYLTLTLMFVLVLLAVACNSTQPGLPPAAITPTIVAASPTTEATVAASATVSPTAVVPASPSPTATASPTPTPSATGVSFDLLNQRGGQTLSVTSAGQIAYLGVGPRLVTLDIADPQDPRFLGQSEVLLGVVQAVVVADDQAYVGTGANLALVNIGDPAAPSLLSYVLTPADLLLLDDNLLVAAGESTLSLWDTTTIPAPTLLAEVEIPGRIAALALHDDLLLVAGPDSADVYMLDIGNPAAPGTPTTLLTAARAGVSSLAVSGHTLYVGGAFSLEAWDIGDPQAPALRGQPQDRFGVVDAILLQGEQAILSSSYADAGVFMRDVTAIPLPEPASAPPAATSSALASAGETILVADAGLSVYHTGGGELLPAGHYAALPPVGNLALTSVYGLFLDGGARSLGSESSLYTLSLPQLEILGQYADQPLCAGCRSALLNVAISDTVAYVGAWEDGLRILDLADPAAPQLVGTSSGFWLVDRLALSGKNAVAPAFLFEENGGGNPELALFDLRQGDNIPPSLPLAPGQQSWVATVAGSSLLAVTDDGSGNQLRLFELPPAQQPPLPAPAGLPAPEGQIYDLAAAGDLAVLVGEKGLSIYSLAPPALLAEIPVTGGAYAVTLVDELALVTSAEREGTGSLYAFDLRDPQAPQLAGQLALPAGQGVVAAAADTVLVGNRQMGLLLLQMGR